MYVNAECCQGLHKERKLHTWVCIAGSVAPSSPRRGVLCCAHTDAYIHTRKKQELPLRSVLSPQTCKPCFACCVTHTHTSACSPFSHLFGPLWLICFMLLFMLRLLLFVKVLLAQPEVASAGRTAVAALLHTLLSRAPLGFLSPSGHPSGLLSPSGLQACLNNKLVGCV